jgi:adenine-specific DNA-methyltransferase
MKEAQKILMSLIKQNCEKHNITWLKNYNRISDDGDVFFGKDLSTPGSPRIVDLPEINLHLEPLATRGWTSDDRFKQLHKDGRLFFRGDRPYEITYLTEAKDHVPSILDFYSRQGTNDLNNLGLRDLFDTPKPVELIKYLIQIYPGESLVVCDFFAGSGTTAQAVLELNQEYGNKHKFVLIQSKEKLDESSIPYKTAISHGLDPYVSDIMLYRIKTFLNKSGLNDIKITVEEVN